MGKFCLFCRMLQFSFLFLKVRSSILFGCIYLLFCPVVAIKCWQNCESLNENVSILSQNVIILSHNKNLPYFPSNRSFPEYKCRQCGPFVINFSISVVTHAAFLSLQYEGYIPIYIQQDATLHSLLISGNCSTCFGWYLHPLSGAHTTVSTASVIRHTTMDEVKLLTNFNNTMFLHLHIHFISNLSLAITVWLITDAVDTVVCAPDDGWRYHPKHVEQFPDKTNCVKLHLVGYILEYIYDAWTHKR